MCLYDNLDVQASNLLHKLLFYLAMVVEITLPPKNRFAMDGIIDVVPLKDAVNSGDPSVLIVVAMIFMVVLVLGALWQQGKWGLRLIDGQDKRHNEAWKSVSPSIDKMAESNSKLADNDQKRTESLIEAISKIVDTQKDTATAQNETAKILNTLNDRIGKLEISVDGTRTDITILKNDHREDMRAIQGVVSALQKTNQEILKTNQEMLVGIQTSNEKNRASQDAIMAQNRQILEKFIQTMVDMLKKEKSNDGIA